MTRTEIMAALTLACRAEPFLAELIHGEATGNPIPVADPSLEGASRFLHHDRHAQRLPDHT